jgi:serine/threonine protein kinase
MAETPQPGELVGGKYRVLRVLGEGGMGVVLEVHHERLDQKMAIKMMRPEFSRNADFVRRFAREARAAARLRSPHAVKVFDVDELPDGRAYMVMELLEGNDLDAEIDTKGTIPIPQIVDWMLQVCAAIGEAHSAGIVHRDLKPPNIFLAESQGGGERLAKVLDFGISRYSKVGDGTTTEQAIGTPQFMSPEQVRGSRGLDGRCDIWAIGVILYRVLTGRFPFSGETATAVVIAIATEPPLPILAARPDLPSPLIGAIMTALEKNPEDRFSTVEQFAAALAPFGSGRVPKSLAASALEATSLSIRSQLGPEPPALVPVRASAPPDTSEDGPGMSRRVIVPRYVAQKTLRAQGVSEKEVTAASGVASATSGVTRARGVRAWHVAVGASLVVIPLAAMRILGSHASPAPASNADVATSAPPSVTPVGPPPATPSSTSTSSTSMDVAPSAASARTTAAAPGKPRQPPPNPAHPATAAPTSPPTAPPSSSGSRIPLHL